MGDQNGCRTLVKVPLYSGCLILLLTTNTIRAAATIVYI